MNYNRPYAAGNHPGSIINPKPCDQLDGRYFPQTMGMAFHSCDLAKRERLATLALQDRKKEAINGVS